MEEKLKFVAPSLAKYNYKNTHGKFLRDTVQINVGEKKDYFILKPVSDSKYISQRNISKTFQSINKLITCDKIYFSTLFPDFMYLPVVDFHVTTCRLLDSISFLVFFSKIVKGHFSSSRQTKVICQGTLLRLTPN